jgi:hypothetical protein
VIHVATAMPNAKDEIEAVPGALNANMPENFPSPAKYLAIEVAIQANGYCDDPVGNS